MIIILLFLLLFVSVTLHILYLTRYIQTHDEKYLKKYILTTISNVMISGGLIYSALYKPVMVQRINFSLVMWLLSGAVMILMLSVQIILFKRTYKRAQMPENYHFNFFGKKVIHNSVIKPLELGIFFVTMPFLLLCGAYFVAKLIRFFI